MILKTLSIALVILSFSCNNEKSTDTNNKVAIQKTSEEKSSTSMVEPVATLPKVEDKKDIPEKSEVIPTPKKGKKSPVQTASKEQETASVISKEPVEETIEMPEPESVAIPKIDFSKVYSQVLSLYVTANGKVNYKGLKKANELVDQAIYHFKENMPEESWSDNQKLAYWINAYNLFTLKLVSDNYPLNSIRDIAGGKPWDKKFIQLGGKTYSLNDIENNIIRKQFKEPRIHFAVNCASVSCPKLINKEYTKDNLNTLLTQQTKAYLADKNENVLGEKAIVISNIFNWYKDDFAVAGGVIDFINKYSSANVQSNAKITFKEYNWNLNE